MSAVRIVKGTPALVLAPMEGVTDAAMRALLTASGGFAFCVSEFVRVAQQVPPARVFYRDIPEAREGWKTPGGTPVQVQLLGGDPDRVAEAALVALSLGAPAVDLNFGCPAKTVNRHDGGASLLKTPSRIERMVSAVRRRVPASVPVSAKIRLGWESVDEVEDLGRAAEAGGADWLTIHGRTKVQGYAPHAHWEPIGRVARLLSIPVVANGDIWSVDHWGRCREITQCEHFMLGRGAVADPGLAVALFEKLFGRTPSGTLDYLPRDDSPRAWARAARYLVSRTPAERHRSRYLTNRIKQWIRMAAVRRDLPWFENLKRMEDLDQVLDYLEA